jgi:AbrB family looped-hinge helix DNA binding protein
MVRISSKGQIVLPKGYREKYDLRAGDYLVVEELDDGALVLERPPQTRIEVLTAELRREVKSRGITRRDLEEAIKETRKRLAR